MTEFLLELRCEEIPARMQAGARASLEKLFRDHLAAAGLSVGDLTIWTTPRRLALIARGLPAATEAVSEEVKGPRTSAPEQALQGFLRKTGLTKDQLTERDGVWFAVSEKPGRATADVLAEAIPAIVRAFPWPKSQRWGAASLSTESLRWVRPLSAIVALLDGEVVDCEVGGIRAGRITRGHRFHAPGEIAIDGVDDYAAKLREAHVLVDHAEREAIVRDQARAVAAAAGLTLVEDEGLVVENAGLTEWPVPLLGRFDAEYLEVPPEVIQLTARTNQKYFICRDADGKLANAFVCTANIVPSDGGAEIVAGNRKVLAARLSDARFFWQQDRKVPLAEQAKKLARITFHEKLGTVADKAERVATLARWLVEEGIVKESPLPHAGGAGGGPDEARGAHPSPAHPQPLPRAGGEFGRPGRARRAAVQGRSRHRDGRGISRTPGPYGRILRPRRRSARCRGRCDPRSLQAGWAGRRRAHRAGNCGRGAGGQAGYVAVVFRNSREAKWLKGSFCAASGRNRNFVSTFREQNTVAARRTSPSVGR